MSEYKASISVSICDYDKTYGSSLESSHHNFFVEAEDAQRAMAIVRGIIQAMGMVTADEHDRAKADKG